MPFSNAEWKNGAVRDASFMDRLVRPNDDFAHNGMNAIRADHGIRRARVVPSAKVSVTWPAFCSSPTSFLFRWTISAGTTAASASCRSARCMHRIRRAEKALPAWAARASLRRCPIPIQMGVRLEGELAQLFPRRRCGAGLSSSWASSECPRRCARSAAPARRPATSMPVCRSVAGSGHAADSGADDCNFWGGHAFCRSLMLKVPF